MSGKPVSSGQNQLMPLQAVRKRVPFQAILKGPKPTSFFPSCSSHAKTNFLYSKQFQSSQNRLLTFQAIPGRPKPTSACLSHSSRAKTYLLHSNPVRTKLTFSLPSHSSQAKTDFLISSHSFHVKTNFIHSKLFQSGKN
jgi:hypothetical protein